MADPDVAVEAYRNGPRHVYVELASEAEVAGLWPDQRALGHLPVAVSTFAGQGPAWKTRMFSPFHGVLVGGSAVIVARGEYRLR